jgi:sporulation protein YlmC with PRC-barrel domain
MGLMASNVARVADRAEKAQRGEIINQRRSCGKGRMHDMKIKSLIVAGVMPLLLSPALVLAEMERDKGQTGQYGAEQHQQHGQHGQARGPAQEQEMRGQRRMTGDAEFINQQQQDQFLAESLIGQSLETHDGEELGEISDLLLDRDGRIAGLIVSVGGGLDAFERRGAAGAGEAVGGREVALRWEAIELTVQDGETVARVDIDRQTLQQAAEFEEREQASFGATAQRERQQETGRATAQHRDRDYGDRAGVREQERDTAVMRDEQRTTGATVQRERRVGMEVFITRQEHDMFTADDLIGSAVHDARGEEIGKIADLLLDRQGEVVGLVVGVGGFLGIGQREVALSWDAVELTTDEDGDPIARIGLDEQTLENAPEFEERDTGGAW